ncbi:MAG: phosphodiester glycosidase family protein [Bacilli bacterium]
MKRNLLLIFGVFVLIFVIGNLMPALAIDLPNEFGEADGAKYFVDEVNEENNLPYGVKHHRDFAYSSTNSTNIMYASGNNGPKSSLFVADQLYEQQINVLEVPNSSNVRITSWANLDNNRWSLTTVKNLAMDYEIKNPGWKVVGAINGDFFDIRANGNLPYQTNGVHISNGENYKTTGNRNVGLTNDGSIDGLIGNEPFTRSENMSLSIYNDNNEIINTLEIESRNIIPEQGKSSVYYGLYNAEHVYQPIATPEEGSIFIVEQSELALPNNDNDFYGKGIISSVSPATIDKGQFAIVTKNSLVEEALSVGKKVRVQWEIEGAYENVTDATGGGDTLLQNGEWPGSVVLDSREPRTVIGRKADGTIMMFVFDGRQDYKGFYGADGKELSAMLKYYDCVEGYNLDGGGSSTLIIRQNGQFVVTNSPSDGNERTDANCLLIVARDPDIDYVITDKTKSSVTFDVQLIDKLDHDIKELFININGEKKNLTDDKLILSDLDSNKEVVYQFGYTNSKDIDILIVSQGITKTFKQYPRIEKMVITETETDWEFEIFYDDKDLASAIDRTRVSIIYNGNKNGNFSLVNGKGKLNKTTIETINFVSMSFSYNIDGKNNIPITMPCPQIKYCMNINNMIYDQGNLIRDIYK